MKAFLHGHNAFVPINDQNKCMLTNDIDADGVFIRTGEIYEPLNLVLLKPVLRSNKRYRNLSKSCKKYVLRYIKSFDRPEEFDVVINKAIDSALSNAQVLK